MAVHERMVGRFIPVGQEVERDWIAAIVTNLTLNARAWHEFDPSFEDAPEFENQAEEIKWWASKDGLKYMDKLMNMDDGTDPQPSVQ